MSRIPFPSELTERAKINLETIEKSIVLHHFYFEFDYTMFRKYKPVKVLHKGDMIIGDIFIKVLTGFNIPNELFLNMGVVEEDDAIMSVPLGATGSFLPFWPRSLSDKYAVPFTKDEKIIVGLSSVNNIVPTQGKGWCIFQWLNMPRIEGYKS